MDPRWKDGLVSLISHYKSSLICGLKGQHEQDSSGSGQKSRGRLCPGGNKPLGGSLSKIDDFHFNNNLLCVIVSLSETAPPVGLNG